ncbi:MAG: MarC family protein [Chitinophagaceae bacterium]|nr:MAG: multiple antibiotic resistance (MarC)-like protein [Bacteroidetes bacterium OLB11]MCC6448414.1 MarC family protein [Chitinophagaceae bacterium]HMN32557.1 MarC family protein [Chitinophagaceae bacterium]
MFDFGINNILYKEIVSATFALFAVIDILGSIPVLISLRNKMGHISAWSATIVSFLLMMGFLFVGEYFLEFLGIDIKSFAIAGSIVLFILGLEMILGWEFFKGENNHKAGSVVPIAFPIIAGSGTLTTIMSIKSIFHEYNIMFAIIINSIIIFFILSSLKWIEKILGQSALLVIRKFFGLILIAIAVKMFRTNLAV